MRQINTIKEKIVMKKIPIIGIFLILLFFVNIADAKRVKFTFWGSQLIKKEEVHGQIVSSTFCENAIDFTNYNLDLDTVSNVGEDVYVSPDEHYFVFSGAESRQAPGRYFLASITNCTIIRELSTGFSNIPSFYSAAFSPDSKKLFMSWTIVNSPSLSVIMNTPGITPDNLSEAISNSTSYINLTKEYSGDGFSNERSLMNMPSPDRAYDDSSGFWYYFYKFSKDDNLFLNLAAKTWTTYIYNILQDQMITSFNNESYIDMTSKSYYSQDNLPSITNGYLVYSWDITNGTEMDVFDYNAKAVVNKITNSYKGLGSFSSNGKRVIFASFADPTTWQVNVIVYDTFTGSEIGQATLDEIDNIVDVSSDDTQLIYNENGVQKTIALQPPS